MNEYIINDKRALLVKLVIEMETPQTCCTLYFILVC